MSAAVIAEQTKYRQALEKALKPYESQIAFVERLAYWENPLHTVGAAIVFTIALNIFVNLVNSTTVVTLLAILGGTLLLGWKLTQTVRFRFSGAPTRGSLDRLIYAIVSVRFGTERFIYHTTSRLQSPEATRYVIRLGAFLLLVAFVGSFFHLSTLVWLAVLGLLIVPGALHRGLEKKVWVVVEPHWRVHWPKVGPKIAPFAAIANGELRNLLALDLAIPVEATSSSTSSSTSSTATTSTQTEKGKDKESSEHDSSVSEDEKEWEKIPTKAE